MGCVLVTAPGNGLALAAAVHGDGELIGDLGSFPGEATRPAEAGGLISIFGTGFGPANPSVADGIIGTLPVALTKELTMFAGGQRAQVDYAGVVGPGLVQVSQRLSKLLAAGEIRLWRQLGRGIVRCSGDLARTPEGTFGWNRIFFNALQSFLEALT